MKPSPDRASREGLLWSLLTGLSDVHGALCVGVRTATVSSHTVYHDVKVLYKH